MLWSLELALALATKFLKYGYDAPLVWATRPPSRRYSYWYLNDAYIYWMIPCISGERLSSLMRYSIPKRAVANLNTSFMDQEKHLFSEIICFATNMSLLSSTYLSSNLIPRINIPLLVVFLEVAKTSSSIALLIINHQQTRCMLAFFN